ncbi:MAG: ATP-binding protein [Nitrospiraceae bacterium]|nr:ATP-binding protein [Nitrospiraceae bacterium]
METINFLKDAFDHFTDASKSLEAYYARLREQVVHLTGTVEEKNRQLQEALGRTEEAKDFLNGILHSLTEAIVVMDASGRVMMINRAAREFLGIDDRAIGRDFEKLGVAIEREGQDVVLPANGGKRHVIISRSDIRDSNGLLRGKVMLFQDITRIKQLEAEQERNHRLIAMGEMAAKIVHEIRSPLCSVELYASMLAGDLRTTRHRDLAEGISTGIRSLNNILTNMLLFALPRKPRLKKIRLALPLRESVFMLKPLIVSRGIHLREEIGEDGAIMGDHELLKQVFMNVILNAVEVTPQRGRVDIGLREEGAEVWAEVSDSGPGIPAADAERIFDPFFSTKEGGTGLGLAITQIIMQAHGASIRVESEPGRGTCFRLVFRCAESAARVAATGGHIS